MNIHPIDTKVYAGRLKNSTELFLSSSGGIFTAASNVVLRKKGAVVASIYNYETNLLGYKLITSVEERDKARGSKYIFSNPQNVFREAAEWLQNNPSKELLFVGVGCHADGFLRYINGTSFRERVTVVDIICHGSPSPKIRSEYSRRIEEKKGKITFLTFKDKRKGWSRATAVASINGREISLNRYTKIFYGCYDMRPSCHECQFSKVKRDTDMTIGDFGNIEKKMPDFYNESGNSLVLIHTNRGLALYEEMQNDIDYKESNTIDCLQRNLEHPTPVSPKRKEFWNDYKEKGIDFVMKKYGTVPMKTKIKNKLLRIIGGYTESSTCYADHSERRVA